MVRGFWADQPNGEPVWQEDAPDRCPAGHSRPTPSWSGCPSCGWGVRVWQCRDHNCGQVVVDPEHTCRS